MTKKYAIGIPTLNRFDLLLPALLFYKMDFPNTKIYVLDNGKQGIKDYFKGKYENLEVIETSQNIGVSASWNLLCSAILKDNDYAIILNDDIYLGRKEWEVDNLLENYREFFYLSTQQWCAYIMTIDTYKKVGEFDTNFFPAYYEDNDYEYRMKLKGITPFKIPFLNPFLYQQSKTLEKSPNLKEFVLKNKQYYIDKWGGEPHKEVFKTPFNK